MTRESGAAGVLVAALVGVALVLSLLVVDVALVVTARAQLTSAADAAALAAAPVTFSAFGTQGDPVLAAAEVAVANGVDLIECSCRIDRTWAPREVIVTVGTSIDFALLGDRYLTGRAAAEFRPIALTDG